ncbi:MAG: SDR family oxidoreductase [Alphaproteobacteria bacterium]|nr:SDR family oxidoreductase [Alphaproteobacteria bacterium]
MQASGAKGIMVGGASGMCRATAELFVRRGGKVAILDRPQSEGAAVADRLGGTFHPCDVVDYAGMERVIEEAADALGGVHFCVNTAGAGVATRTLSKEGEMHPLDTFHGVVQLNLVASFNINRVAAKLMARNEPNEAGERGVMINTASIAAFEGQIGQVAYAAAKAGIAGMTLTMARDLGLFGIRVMTIAPSLFDTGLTRGIPADLEQRLVKDAAFPRRMGQPEEFATMALAIFDCPMMNGSVIRVDGGQRFAPR